MSPERIMELACESFGLTVISVFKGKKPKAGKPANTEDLHMHIKSIVAELIKEYNPKMTLKEIGEFYGGVDHSTISYYLRTGYKLKMKSDDLYLQRRDKVYHRIKCPPEGSIHVWLSSHYSALKKKNKLT